MGQIYEAEVIEKMKTKRQAAIYARVSASSGQDTYMQIRELKEYCRNRDWKIAGVFVDSGISGAKDSRPEINRLMEDAHRRRFDVVAVWKFNRFASTSVTGDILGVRDRIHLTERTTRHQYANRQNGFYNSWKCRRARKIVDRRTHQSGATRCKSEGGEIRTTSSKGIHCWRGATA